MTIEVPPDKLESICALLDKWLVLPRATKSELQSLIGKLAFVCACISPGRIFIQRMLHDLRQLQDKKQRFTPSEDMGKDICWWRNS